MPNIHLNKLNQNKYKILTATILLIFFILPIIYLLIIASDVFKSKNYTFELCTNITCYEYFLKDFKKILSSLKELIYFSAQLITLSSISIAALTYLSSKKNNDIAIANNYFSIFRSIVDNSFDVNFRKIHSKDINYHLLFRKIYPSINKGEIKICKNYINELNELNNSINSINPEKINETSNIHKKFFLNFCKNHGIQIENDFNNRVFLIIENEIVEFLNRLNQSIFEKNINPQLKIRTIR